MRMARAEGAQANNKRAARQCGKRRWFAPRKVSVFFVDYGPKGAGGQAKSHLAFLPEYLYPVGVFRQLRPEGDWGRAESPLLAAIIDNFAARNSPLRGLTCRFRREERACSLHGVLIYFGGDPKGCRGRAESHPASMTRDNFAVRNSPLRGLDAPTPARGQGLQP